MSLLDFLRKKHLEQGGSIQHEGESSDFLEAVLSSQRNRLNELDASMLVVDPDTGMPVPEAYEQPAFDSVTDEKVTALIRVSNNIESRVVSSAEAGLLDYDDLLEVLRDALSALPDLRTKLQNRFRYIMVDEYQDTNLVQKELVDLLVANDNITVVEGIKFNEKRHVKDIIAHLRLAVNPMDAVAWMRVLKLLSGIGQGTAKKLITHLANQNGS